MNKVSEQKLVTFLEALRKSITENQDFAIERAPDYIQELLLWYTASSIAWAAIGCLILIAGIWLLRRTTIPEIKQRLKRLKKESEEYNNTFDTDNKGFRQRLDELTQLSKENEQHELTEEQEETLSWGVAPLLYLLVGGTLFVNNTLCLLKAMRTPEFVVLEEIACLIQESETEATPLSVTFGVILFLTGAGYLSMCYHAWKKTKCPACGKHRLSPVSTHSFSKGNIRSNIVFESCDKCGRRFKRIVPKVKLEAISSDEEWNHYCKVE